MLPKSTNYDTIWANPNHYAQVQIIVGEVGGTRTTYTADNILSLDTHMSLYGEFIDIGQCVINSFEAMLTGVLPTEIPKMSRVEVWVRLRAGTAGTNWLPKGVFYTRKPEYDPESGRLSISGYDTMYRGEALPYPLGSTVSGWDSETTRTVAGRMATFMDITLEDATQIPVYAFALPPFGYTAREILHDIGTACGGNFTLTYANVGTQTNLIMQARLRFIPIGQMGTITYLGRNVQSFTKGDTIPTVGYVCVNYGYDNQGATLSKEHGTQGSGRDVEFTISTITDGSVIESIAEDLYDTLDTLTYIPWTATGVPLDPAVEIGDIGTCNNLTAVMGSIDTAFSKAMYASVIAPPIPEEEDFPMYSADREIQRNYVTEASKIAGTVKFVDLSTSGATEINGANIKTGTITLGGSEAGSPEMVLLDENDNVIGRWDKDRITIFDDTTGLTYESAKFKVVRQGDADTSEYGVFIGTGQLYGQFYPDVYPNECTPYILLYGTRDYTSSGNDEGSILLYPGRITVTNSNGDSTYIVPTSESIATTATKTDNNSTANMTSRTVKQWGNVAQMTVHLTEGSSYASAGAVMWEGDIEPQSGTLPQPIDQVTACGVNGANFCIGQLTGDSANNKWHLVVRAVNGYTNGWTANLSFTFLV